VSVENILKNNLISRKLVFLCMCLNVFYIYGRKEMYKISSWNMIFGIKEIYLCYL